MKRDALIEAILLARSALQSIRGMRDLEAIWGRAADALDRIEELRNELVNERAKP